LDDDNEGEVKEETPPDRKPAKYWHNQIQAAEEREKKWRETGKKIVARYLDERDGYEGGEGCERRVNIFWSNTEVLKSNLFAELGSPDVRRAFPKPGKANKIARTAALVLERNLVACGNRYDPDVRIEDAITDMLTPGRGQCWIEYDPTIEEGADGNEKIAYQTVMIAHVCWDDWTHGAAKKWEDVPWVARKLLFNAKDCAEAWPQFNISEEDPRTTIPCNHVLIEGKDRAVDQGAADFKRAVIWEIWHKRSKRRIYVANDFEWELQSNDDPYRLENFFPCPKPLFSVKYTDRLIPKAEYLQYKDQAEELDRVNTRIWKLVESLKFRGVRWAGQDGQDSLSDIDTLDDGQFLPLKNFQMLAQGGGLKEAFQVIDLAPIAAAIQAAAQRALELIQSIYEITGISDIVRGSSDPNETLGAQKMKASFGSTRMKKRQQEVQRFVRDLYRMKGEIIAEHFEREQLSEASGVLLPTEAERQQARQLLQAAEMQKKQAEMAAQQPPQGPGMGHNGGPPMAGPQQQTPPQQPPMPPQAMPQDAGQQMAGELPL
jgi:hypothetical protein